MRKSHWGIGFEGQPLPGYRIVVTSGRGRKMHTFVLVSGEEEVANSPLHWEHVTETFRDHSSGIPGSRPMPASLSKPLPEKVHLATSVDIPSSILTAILDALVSGSRHKIAIDDVNYIVSEQGSDIAKVCALPEEQRGLAESALYATILRRCSSI